MVVRFGYSDVQMLIMEATSAAAVAFIVRRQEPQAGPKDTA
jgi:hypothetical protein